MVNFNKKVTYVIKYNICMACNDVHDGATLSRTTLNVANGGEK
jgi:hypothetical protein